MYETCHTCWRHTATVEKHKSTRPMKFIVML
jgi:hypothetical protein